MVRLGLTTFSDPNCFTKQGDGQTTPYGECNQLSLSSSTGLRVFFLRFESSLIQGRRHRGLCQERAGHRPQGEGCRFWNQTGSGLSPSLQCWRGSTFCELQPSSGKRQPHWLLLSSHGHPEGAGDSLGAHQLPAPRPARWKCSGMAGCYCTWCQRISC